MFDVPPKCPALADKITGLFGWRHTYRVSQKHKGISHTYLQKSYSLTLPQKKIGTESYRKEPDSWVVVHHLQTQSGILDPDDYLKDVADDREQILASFEDTGPDPGVHQGGGDGASGSSSVGTGSPDIFRDPTNPAVVLPQQGTVNITNVGSSSSSSNSHHHHHNKSNSSNSNNINNNSETPHIEVTSTTVAPHSGLGLQVRRSSDPNLLQTLKSQSETTKRWSAAAPASGSESPDRLLDKVGYLSPQWEEEDDTINSPIYNQHQNNNHLSVKTNFPRSGRHSMQFLGDGNGYKWMEAAEKLQSQIYATKSLPREAGKRKEPLGQAYESIREKNGEMLLIINEYGGPLGLTAIPDREHGGGLLVQNVEPGSRAEKGRLRKGDRILEINGTKLAGMTESQVQEYLRRSLAASELRIRVIRGNHAAGGKNRKDTKISEMIEAEEKSSGTKVATVSPTRKMPGAPAGTSLQVANTRKLGRKIEIILKKGPHGLGFSVTTRDNPAGGQCPIYIKNILPRGAAIEDGRLKPGDRLLEVDGLPMTGKSQSEVVSILRATQPGSTVRIVVSRQQELSELDEREINFSEEHEDAANRPPKPPTPVLPTTSKSVKGQMDKIQSIEQQQLAASEQHFIDGGSESAASSDSLQAGIAWRNREVLTLHIPVHDTEKAGLGVSVKGKTNSLNNSSSGSSNASMKHDGDLGIFVKSVLHGGAASRDGRLRMNDQLISVNGVSLLGQSNAEAMETLRRAMIHTPGKHPGVITLTVARKITRSHSSGDILENQQQDSSNTSDNSGTTVIYLSPDKKETKENMNRWSNPVLERLTGGVCPPISSNKRPSTLYTHGLRNESYYMATNDTWSPFMMNAHTNNGNIMNNSVLIEDDSELLSPILPNRPNDSVSTQQSSSSAHNCDATYSSQLSLDTNTSTEHFSRDAVGRKSISEKHHAALDARETGTYQRNKKIREEREKERRSQLTKSAILSGSVESLTRIAGLNSKDGERSGNGDLTREALDEIRDLGPSLGLKKSSSLESLQTMVQEIQMADEPRGPTMLRAPRGRGREESLRAAVCSPDVNKPRKHWLLEEGPDSEGGFSNRNGPFQSSLNDGKHKNRAKKPSILRGIGHMFRFGKHRKDGVAPVETVSEFGVGATSSNQSSHSKASTQSRLVDSSTSPMISQPQVNSRPKCGPPTYQPPPPPGANLTANAGQTLHNDLFNHRYQHYVNYDDLHHHPPQISRRHQHYHSQRSTRTHDMSPSYMNHLHLQQQQQQRQQPQSPNDRPISSYYEYETIQHNVRSGNGGGSNGLPLGGSRKINIGLSTPPSSPTRQHWKAATINGFGPARGSGRNRGPFITQVTIREREISSIPSNSSLNGNYQQQSHHVQRHHHSNNNNNNKSNYQNSLNSTQQPHASKV